MARLFQNSNESEVNSMYALYNARVLSILGGFRDTAEIALCERCFYQHLDPAQAAQVIINNR